MPRAFDITSSGPGLRLNGGESGEIAFTVSNKLARPIRARAVPQPDGETKASWLSISGGAERDFGADETQLITVRVQLPKGVKEGSYDFHLVVSSLAEPDELYAVGGTVPIVVKQAERKFPWWIVILAGGLLVIGGGAFGLVKLLGDGGTGAPPGADCATNQSCPANQRCVEIRPGAKSCLLKPGETCTGDIQCASAYCRPDDRRCSRDDGLCTPATAEQDCRPGTFQCTGNRCLLAEGQRCQDHDECATNFCLGSRCARCTAQCVFPNVCFRNQCVLRVFPFVPKVLPELRRFEGIRR